MTSSFRPTDLLLATELEAKPILMDGSLGWSFNKKLGAYQSFHYPMRLWITGIGPTRSAFSMGKAMGNFRDTPLNLGVVGALVDDLPVGKAIEVGQVVSADERHPFDRRDDLLALKNLNALPEASPQQLTCVTVGEAVHDECRRQQLGAKGQVVDMELYALAACCRWGGLELSSMKVISDLASASDAKAIVKRIPELMAELWGTVKALMA